MIIETKITTLDNKVIKVNKKNVPRSINKDLVPLYMTSIFVGSKNSGKTYGLVKLLKNFEQFPVYDNNNNKLDNRIILICPTANSTANPIFHTLRDLDENDIFTEYNDDILQMILDDIKREKDEIIEREEYIRIYNKLLKSKSLNKMNDEELIILEKYDYRSPDELPKLKYNHPPIIFMILDDMIGTNNCFKRGNCLISNLTIKHRHLGINLLFTTQNPKSIPNIIRANIDLWVLYKFSNANIIIDKCYEEVSSLIDENQFLEMYLYATKEPYNAFVIDTHPLTDNNKRFKMNYDVVLSI